MLLPQYNSSIQTFLNHLSLVKRYSPHTIRSYGDDLQLFLDYLEKEFNTTDPAQVLAPMVRSWLVALKEGGASPTTLRRRISSLQSFYKFRIKSGFQLQSPMAAVTAPKLNKRLPVYVEKAQLETLFSRLEFPDTWEGHTHQLVLLLLYHTGMRRAELTGLTRGQLEFSRQQLRILGKGNKERMIPLQPELIAHLKNYLHRSDCPLENTNADTPLLLNEKGRKLADKTVYNIVHTNLSLVTTVEKRSPHVLRHSFATHLSNNGADLNAIKELLGHSSLAATQIYTHNTIGKLKEAHKKAHPKGD